MTIDRVVLDTNVLIRSILTERGAPALLLEALRARRATLLSSDETLDELKSRLLRPKFDRYVSVQSRHRFLAQIDAVSDCIAIACRPMGCRDPQDDKFLKTALLGDAEMLVSGDRDLLTMSPFDGLEICAPADALARIQTA